MMDSFSSDHGDGLAAMSLSLVSYGSDLDASVGDTTPNLTLTNSIGESDTLRNKDDQRIPTPMDLDSLLQRAQKLSLSGLSAAKRKQLEAAMAEAAASRAELQQTEVICRAYEQVLASDKLPQPTRENAQKHWHRHQLQRYVGAVGNTGVLGLNEGHLWQDLPQGLSNKDRKIVQLAVEAQLIENARELNQAEVLKQETLRKLSGNSSNSTANKAESDHTSKMATLWTQHNNELDKFYKLLVSLDSLLETIVQIRTNKMSETCIKTVEGWEAKAQLLKQKAKQINLQMQSAFHTEDPSIIPALQHLEKDLDLIHSELEVEIEKSNELLAAYDRVRCPEYDKILAEYRGVMTEIKSSKYLLNELVKNKDI